MLDVKPGDELMMRNVNHGTQRVIVEKVGPKNIFIKGQREPFDRTTGRVKDNYGHSQLVTIEAYEKSIGIAVKQLEAFGVEFGRGVNGDKVLAVYALLEPLILDEAKQRLDAFGVKAK